MAETAGGTHGPAPGLAPRPRAPRPLPRQVSSAASGAGPCVPGAALPRGLCSQRPPRGGGGRPFKGPGRSVKGLPGATPFPSPGWGSGRLERAGGGLQTLLPSFVAAVTWLLPRPPRSAFSSFLASCSQLVCSSV